MDRFPESTYRLQFHAGFTFRQAREIVPYLRELGITHVYASPYLKARPGSTHGYDVVDPEKLNPEIGSQEDFDAWLAALREHGMEHILDIVPNHMGVGTNENAWWNDVLENGPASRFAGYFDISWRGSPRADLHDRLLLPLLGDRYGAVLERGELRLIFENGAFFVRYYDRRFPVSPLTYVQILKAGNAPNVPEYRDIAAALEALPETPPAERFDRQERIKRRVALLADRSSTIRDHIAQNVEMFNGKPGDPASFDLLDDLLNHQFYRLSYWKVAPDEINYRRFFDVNELTALSVERPEVFEATHRLILRLLAEQKLWGLRVDHPDGLYDPKQYFLRLQRAYLGAIGKATPGEADAQLIRNPPLYLVVEKILAPGEPLPEDWAVHGTTGYDALNMINGLFVDANNEQAFTELYREFTGNSGDYDELAYRKKLLILDVSLASELQTLTAQLERLACQQRRSRDFTRAALREALRQVIACFPVYRTYISDEPVRPEDRRVINDAIDRAMRRNPTTPPAILEFVRDMLLQAYPRGVSTEQKAQQRRFAGKFQQLTAPVTAKGVEDTAFYVYNRLVSLNEVGGEPGRFGVAPQDAHEYFRSRQARWPHGLTPLSTHDTKRSEDVRSRINVLSEIPGEWRTRVPGWREVNAPHRTRLADSDAPSPNDEYLLYQTLVGSYPLGRPAPQEHATFVSRIQAYMQKAMREAKVRTSWTDPNAEYEKAVETFVARILDRETGRAFLDDFLPFQSRVAHWGLLNSLSQTVLRLTTPGVPDTYQGTELWDFSLVDPDNRRAVDYHVRREGFARLKADFDAAGARRGELAHELANHLDDGRIKLFAIWQTLQARNQSPDLFSAGTYIPIESLGPRSDCVFAFARTLAERWVVVVVPRFVTRLGSAPTALPLGSGVWQQTRLVLPPDSPTRWQNIYTGQMLSSSTPEGQPALRLADLLADFPVGVLLSQ